MYAIAIRILSSAQLPAVEHRPFTAVIRSHRWLHACLWHPIFSLQLLLPPRLLLPQSYPESCPSTLALPSSGTGQILLLGTRCTAASSYCTRADMSAGGGKPGTSGFVKDIKRCKPHYPQKAFSWTPFHSPLLGRIALMEGWDSSGACNHSALTYRIIE